MNDDDADLSIFPPPVRTEPARLYLISPQEVGGGFPDQLKAAVTGGPVAAFQLRVKDVNEHELARLAEPLQRICADHDCAFIVNDSMALAKRIGADDADKQTVIRRCELRRRPVDELCEVVKKRGFELMLRDIISPGRRQR